MASGDTGFDSKPAVGYHAASLRKLNTLIIPVLLAACGARGELDYSTGSTIEVGGGLGLQRL